MEDYILTWHFQSLLAKSLCLSDLINFVVDIYASAAFIIEITNYVGPV